MTISCAHRHSYQAREPESSQSWRDSHLILLQRWPEFPLRGNERDCIRSSGLADGLPSPMHFANDFSRALRHVHFIQLFYLEESSVLGIRSSTRVLGSGFANIINDDVVVCDLAFGVLVDSVDNLADAKRLHFLFRSLREAPSHRILQAFSKPDDPASDGPFALCRWLSPLNQQHSIAAKDDATNGADRVLLDKFGSLNDTPGNSLLFRL